MHVIRHGALSNSDIELDDRGATVPQKFAKITSIIAAPSVAGGEVRRQIDVRHLPTCVEMNVRAFQRDERK